MVLQSVKTASGRQFFRKPDGKLVQLVPLSQLRVNKNLCVQKSESSVNMLIILKHSISESSLLTGLFTHLFRCMLVQT